MSQTRKLRVHTARSLTDDEKGILLALAQVLPIWTFYWWGP